MVVKIKENGWVASIAAAKLRTKKVAIVFGDTIYLSNTTREEFLNNQRWVCHELKHVEQYQQFGFWEFIARYLFESLKSGYHQNKFEIEARLNESNLSLLDKFNFG